MLHGLWIRVCPARLFGLVCDIIYSTANGGIVVITVKRFDGDLKVWLCFLRNIYFTNNKW